MAATWFAPLIVEKRDRRRNADCTWAIRTALSDCKARTLGELGKATGNRWSAQEMGAALVKLVKRGEVLSIPPLSGKKGKAYRWMACSV